MGVLVYVGVSVYVGEVDGVCVTVGVFVTVKEGGGVGDGHDRLAIRSPQPPRLPVSPLAR